MAKAYDRISWSFILAALRSLGFSELLCDMVFRNFSNNWYSIQWDGKTYGFFKSTRGVRQGDPLSPTLFIIAMEWLSKALNDSMSRGSIEPYFSKRRALKISHLLFADDILVFANGSSQSMEGLMAVLDKFCNISGQCLNPNKSQIFFSCRLTNAEKLGIINTTQFVGSNFPVIYLGAPLFAGRVKIAYFEFLLTKLQCRIEGWMKNLLSMAGRLSLVESVLQSISIHVISVLPIPSSCIRQLERLLSNFLWDNGQKQRHHWISFNRICRPKDSGGLGLRSFHDIILSLHAKLAWNFLQQRSLWARYAASRFQLGKPGSPIWNSIWHLIDHIKQHSLWLVGNGDTEISVFCDLFNIQIPSGCLGLRLHDIFNTLHLKINLLCSLPSRAISHYQNTVLSTLPDRIIWTGTPSGDFTSKDFLETFRTQHQNLEWAKAIWQSWLPPKISLFIWKLCLNGLPLDQNFKKVGIQMASRCMCCGNKEETSNHLFFQGQWATEVWKSQSITFMCNRPLTLAGFLRSWLLPPKKQSFLQCLKVGLACCSLWEIWKTRNTCFFEGKQYNFMREIEGWVQKLSYTIPFPLESDKEARRVALLLNVSPPQLRTRGQWMTWDPGNKNFCLNIAIICFQNQVKGAGLLRSIHGDFVLGFIETFHKSDMDEELLSFTRRALRSIPPDYIISEVQTSHPRQNILKKQQVIPWLLYNQLSSFYEESRHIKFVRICSMQNHAAISLAYKSPENALITNRHELHIAVRRGIMADKHQHRIFCPNPECKHSDPTQPETSADDLQVFLSPRHMNITNQGQDDAHYVPGS